MTTDYYTRQTGKLLKQFDKAATRARPRLVGHYGDLADAIIEETRAEYARVIPELPYIGGKRNMFTPIIIVNGWILAYHRTMKTRGASTEEIVKLMHGIAEDLTYAYPRFLLRLVGRMMGSWSFRRRLRAFAAQTQEREYPEDFVATYLEGDEGFDWGWEFSECAVCKFMTAQGIEDLLPFCSFVDHVHSTAMGMGMEHVTVIGMGDPVCRIELKRGRETPMKDNLREALAVEIAGNTDYMQNVFVKGAGTVARHSDGAELPGDADAWLRVAEYAHGIDPPNKRLEYEYKAPVYLDG